MDNPERNLTNHPGAHRVDLSDDGDSVTGGDAITKEEIQQQDYETLTGEEEAERLLGGADRSNDGSKSVRRPRHRNQRRLEEGGRLSSATSSVTSSQEDIRRTSTERAQERKVCRYDIDKQEELLADPQLMTSRLRYHYVDDSRHCTS